MLSEIEKELLAYNKEFAFKAIKMIKAQYQ